MNELDRVPCIQVDNVNLKECWPHLVSAIEQSHFAAIDCEFSGLGDRKKLWVKDIEDRYKVASKIAKTRSILSVGVSFFRYHQHHGSENLIAQDDGKEWSFKVINFDILTLCCDESVLEEDSAKFLIAHGFDFDRQKIDGLPYSRGYQVEPSDDPSIRRLFKLLLEKKVPLIFHNGFLDLIFIYQNFYAELPSKLTTFVADLNQMFPKGIFDTKLIASSIFDPKVTYLEYLYYQRQRCNLEQLVKNLSYLSVIYGNDETLAPYSIERSMRTLILSEKPKGLKLCDDYGKYGWCEQGNSCEKSHDIDFILDDEKDYKEPSKNRRKILNKINAIFTTNGDGLNNQSPGEKGEEKPHTNGQVKSGIHRSGYDAFMTGFIFASFMVEMAEGKPEKTNKLNFFKIGMGKAINKIFLTGKKDSLQIHWSPYSKPSSCVKKMVTKGQKGTKEKEKSSDICEPISGNVEVPNLNDEEKEEPKILEDDHSRSTSNDDDNIDSKAECGNKRKIRKIPPRVNELTSSGLSLFLAIIISIIGATVLSNFF